jgi:hypothetical protein
VCLFKDKAMEINASKNNRGLKKSAELGYQYFPWIYLYFKLSLITKLYLCQQQQQPCCHNPHQWALHVPGNTLKYFTFNIAYVSQSLIKLHMKKQLGLQVYTIFVTVRQM